jgi:hypothetical protein
VEVSATRPLRRFVPFEHGLGEVDDPEVPECGDDHLGQLLCGARNVQRAADPDRGLPEEVQMPPGTLLLGRVLDCSSG